MPLQFDRYRMTDGRTRLGAAYFNPVLADLDLRLAELEQLRLDWEAAIGALQRFGLERIDSTLGPLLDTLDERMAQQLALLTQLVADQQSLALIGYRDPAAAALTFDGQGRLATITETLGEDTRVITLGYDQNDRLASAVAVDPTKTRTETYGYDANGRLTGMSAVEVPA